MSKTCPNCGAPISSWQCNYCGAVFYDFSSLDISFDKPIFIRFKFDGKTVETKVRLSNFNVNSQPDTISLYANNRIVDCMTRMQTEIDMNFHVIDDIVVMEENNNG